MWSRQELEASESQIFAFQKFIGVNVAKKYSPSKRTLPTFLKVMQEYGWGFILLFKKKKRLYLFI